MQSGSFLDLDLGQVEATCADQKAFRALLGLDVETLSKIQDILVEADEFVHVSLDPPAHWTVCAIF